MYMPEAVLHTPHKTQFLKFNRFELKDKALVNAYVKRFNPESCEYNFSNLFAWQGVYDLCFTLYQGRLLIYDAVSQCAFMPLGDDFYPEELVVLALQLKSLGIEPSFGLVTSDYLKKYPDIEAYFMVKEERDHAEYLYEVKSLCDLTGEKLHKKKNLISQFRRSYPDYQVHGIKGELKAKCFLFAQELLNSHGKASKDLVQELFAIETSFRYFDELGLEGLAVTVDERLVAFSVFSRLNGSTYDIQFEKSDAGFKGAAQVINHETAKYLQDICRYVNREQDLGIKGLRQAKL
ncbi:MAG: phosphatidylglycerol lysyltransferase domain-containing protein, partial [Desulfobacula sp.]